MNLPSVKTLARLTEHPHQLRRLLEGSVEPDIFESVRAWVAQCYNAPSWEEQVMCAANEFLDGHGVEPLDLEAANNCSGDPGAYVNMGDTYKTTLLLTPEGRFIVGSWGDYVERKGL